MQPEETKENDTDKLMIIITEIKQISDQYYHDRRNDRTKKELIVDTVRPVTTIPTDEEIIKDKKCLPI